MHSGELNVLRRRSCGLTIEPAQRMLPRSEVPIASGWIGVELVPSKGLGHLVVGQPSCGGSDNEGRLGEYDRQ